VGGAPLRGQRPDKGTGWIVAHTRQYRLERLQRRCAGSQAYDTPSAAPERSTLLERRHHASHNERRLAAPRSTNHREQAMGVQPVQHFARLRLATEEHARLFLVECPDAEIWAVWNSRSLGQSVAHALAQPGQLGAPGIRIRHIQRHEVFETQWQVDALAE
jgi:hypothetical protein